MEGKTHSKMLRRIESNAGVFFGTGLLMYILGYIILYSAIAGIWIVVYQTLLPAGADDPKYSNAVSVLNFIVSFVYFIYIKESMDGFTTTAEQCCRLLVSISTMCVRVFDAMDGMKLYDIQTDPIIEDFRDCSILTIYTSYRIFNMSVKKVDQNDFYTSIILHPRVPPIKSDQILRLNAHVEEATELEQTGKVRHIISHLIRLVNDLETKGYIQKGYSITILNDQLRPIYKSLEDIEIGGKIVTPDFIRHHIIFILVFWFVLYLPYYIWTTAGWQTLIGLYWIILFIFTGPMIYRRWIGEAFAENRLYNFMPHEEWCTEYMEVVYDRHTRLFRNDVIMEIKN